MKKLVLLLGLIGCTNEVNLYVHKVLVRKIIPAEKENPEMMIETNIDGMKITQMIPRKKGHPTYYLSGSGTAFIYRGYIVTASHVCSAGSTIQLLTDDRELIQMHTPLRNMSPLEDICIIERAKIEGLKKSTALSKIGFSHGYPADVSLKISKMEYVTTTRISIGQISSDVDVYLGEIISGMSGGPVVDSDGNLLGLNMATDFAGHGYVVPVREINRVIDSLEKEVGK